MSKSPEKCLENVRAALERANQKGCFTLEESFIIYADVTTLTKFIKEREESKIEEKPK